MYFSKCYFSVFFRGPKRTFFTKMVIPFQNSVFGEIHFSQKSLTYEEKQPHILPQDIVQQNQITCCC